MDFKIYEGACAFKKRKKTRTLRALPAMTGQAVQGCRAFPVSARLWRAVRRPAADFEEGGKYEKRADTVDLPVLREGNAEKRCAVRTLRRRVPCLRGVRGCKQVGTGVLHEVRRAAVCGGPAPRTAALCAAAAADRSAGRAACCGAGGGCVCGSAGRKARKISVFAGYLAEEQAR